ncbi:MAG: selenium metabolism-associated LysR family transcriptional regulator [Syntrophomonadaceae bacterium]|jgi:DNA-binding transcriptional LysR family regulator|nr:LysR family transcriptional regulator [Syntrophomonadaceae bacterium]
MNLNLFKTYVRVVETQNLSRTANEFGLSQPAITKQIQALEDIYGVLLLERSGRRLKTTEAGEALYHCAREIIKAIDKTENIMEDVVESRRGYISLGASTIPGEYILPILVKNFKDNNPSIRISMDIGDTERIFNKVAERELDIGVVGAWYNNRKVDGFQWVEDELVITVPDHHRMALRENVHLSELASEKWVFRQKGSGTRKIAEELIASSGLKMDDINIYMEVGSTEAVLATVEAGMGISIVSEWAIQRLDPHRKIVSLKIADEGARRYFYIIYPHQKKRRKSVLQFMEFLQNIKGN